MGVVGDVCRAVGAKMQPWCDEIVTILLQDLTNPRLNREVMFLHNDHTHTHCMLHNEHTHRTALARKHQEHAHGHVHIEMKKNKTAREYGKCGDCECSTRTHARKRVHYSTIVIALITHRIVLAAGETADSGCVW